MADYTPLLSRAVIGQDKVAREGIYARAREALERQLRGFEPRLTEEQIIAELDGLAAAIASVEAQAGAAEATAEEDPAADLVAAPAPEAKAEAPNAPPSEGEPVPAEPEPEAAPAQELREEDVLRAASTDEVSAPDLGEPAIAPVARPRMPLRHENGNRRKPLVLAAGAALVVILGMGALAITRRSSPDPLRGQHSTAEQLASVETSKKEGRLSTETPAGETAAPVPEKKPPPQPPQQGEPALATSTRAFMVLEGSGNAPSQFEGRALWSFEPDPALRNQKGLRTIIAYPGAETTIDLMLSRNADAAIDASHLIMAVFDLPKGSEPVREMSPVEWREKESQPGSVLRGSVVPVQDNVFMLTLEKAALAVNLDLLRAQKWMVFEFRFANGRRGAALVEKGAPGERAMSEALASWK